jgi:hypothetical protein
MALSTVDGWAAAVANNGQDIQITKNVPTVGVANIPHSLWAGGGTPVAGTYPVTGKANGRTVTDASTGGRAYVNAPSGTMYLTRVGMIPQAATCQGTILLVDRISDCSILLADTTGAVTGLDATSRLPAAAAGAEGAQIFIYAQTALGTATTFNLTYTNQAGTGSQVTPNIVSTASAVINRSLNAGLFVPLATGDTGVRSIETFTAVSGSGTGTLSICLVRVLARIPIPVAGVLVERDLISELPGPKTIYSDSCFDWILVPTGAAVAATPMLGNLLLAYGLAMAVTWNSVGPWGYQAELPGGVVATVSLKGAGTFKWSLTHKDLPLRMRGEAPTLGEARADIIAATTVYATNLADLLDARALVLTQRATACRNWVTP